MKALLPNEILQRLFCVSVSIQLLAGKKIKECKINTAEKAKKKKKWKSEQR